MADALNQMIDDLRAHRPKVYDADEIGRWYAALAHVVQALPQFEQRWASVALVSDDMARAMAMPIASTFRFMAVKLLSAEDYQQLMMQAEESKR